MSTTIVTTCATDLNTLGPIYPFVGSEMILFIVGLVFWIGFHVLQGRIEARELEKEEEALRKPGRMAEALKFRDHQDRF